MNAESILMRFFLGQNGMASGTLDAGAFTIFGGASAHLFGSIAGNFDGSAASAGQRGTADGTMLPAPLTQFNGLSVQRLRNRRCGLLVHQSLPHAGF